MLENRIRGLETQESKKPQILEWHLAKEGNTISLMCYDKTKNREWYVAKILPSGELRLPDSIPGNIGLKLDGKGRIKLQPEG